jgi:hypothetical protein
MWAGVENVREQEKPEARKMLEKDAESHTSGARFVRCFLIAEDPICFHRGLQILRLFHKILFLVFP